MDEITPLFAIEAEQLLLSGFVEEAIELCNKGLEVFPDYPTAKVILAKSYLTIGKKEQSELVLAQAKSSNYGKILDKINFDDTIQTIEKSNFTEQLDASFQEKDLHSDILIDNNNKALESNSFKPTEIDDFNDEIKKIIALTDDSPCLVEEEVIISLTSEVNFDELDNFNKEFKDLINSVKTVAIKSEVLSSSTTSTTHFQVNESRVEHNFTKNNNDEDKQVELPITNTLSKILTKNKNEFFHQEDLNEKIFKIEDSISNSINSFNKLSPQEPKKVKISIEKDNFDKDNTKLLVMGLINTRFINSKKQKNTQEKSNELPVYTETMAKIFTAQGAKDKAINIYRKLMINDPSKKDYYNAQIDKIK